MSHHKGGWSPPLPLCPEPPEHPSIPGQGLGQQQTSSVGAEQATETSFRAPGPLKDAGTW